VRDQLKFYEKSLSIDKENLDEEIANFPSMFWTVSDFYLDAYRHCKRLEERLDRTFASIAGALRSAAQEEKGARGVTETQIKQEVVLHPRYRKLKARLNQARYVKDRWAALKDSYLQKSFSLKGLVQLSMHENFQQSHVSEENVARKTRRRGQN